MVGLRNEFKGSVQHWWIYPLLGALFIVMSSLIISRPLSSYAALVYYFIFTFLISGVIRIVFAIVNRENIQNWGWYFAGGVLDLVFGGLLLSRIGVAAMILPFYVGFFIMFSSMSAISKAIDLRSYHFEGWERLLLMGGLGLICSILLLLNPALSVGTIIIWTGLGFLMMGIFYVYLGLRFRKIHHFIDQISHA